MALAEMAELVLFFSKIDIRDELNKHYHYHLRFC
jgi:hypothetical protein